MRALGLGPDDVRARVSDRRLLNALLRASGVTEAQLPRDVSPSIDKIERDACAQSEQRLVDAGLTRDVAADDHDAGAAMLAR